jgi:hypothetical protein
MKVKPAYPLFSDPNETPNNLQNPYEWNEVDCSRGETRFKAPESNSTMVSDSVEMTKRLRAFVPASSVQKGRQPSNGLGYENSPELENEGTYKSTFQ